jgi:hypothetical protein
MTATVQFDETLAKTYQPRPVPRRVRVMEAAPDERTTIAAEWGEEEHFVGRWVAVLDDRGGIRYGISYAEFIDTHEQVPGAADLWRKTTTVDAYRHTGAPGRVVTMVGDLLETFNAVREGDWLVRQHSGAVQVIADGPFRAFYDVEHPVRIP